MNVRLGHYEAWVQERIDSGEYGSAAEVVRAGLRLLKEEEEWRKEVRAKIAESIAATHAGRFVESEEPRARAGASLEDPDQPG